MITQENIQYTADEIKAMLKTCEKYNWALHELANQLDMACDTLALVADTFGVTKGDKHESE